MKGCICHFVKCQLHPFISGGNKFMWGMVSNWNLGYVVMPKQINRFQQLKNQTHPAWNLTSITENRHDWEILSFQWNIIIVNTLEACLSNIINMIDVSAIICFVFNITWWTMLEKFSIGHSLSEWILLYVLTEGSPTSTVFPTLIEWQQRYSAQYHIRHYTLYFSTLYMHNHADSHLSPAWDSTPTPPSDPHTAAAGVGGRIYINQLLT